jgi:hypothetical protein
LSLAMHKHWHPGISNSLALLSPFPSKQPSSMPCHVWHFMSEPLHTCTSLPECPPSLPRPLLP